MKAYLFILFSIIPLLSMGQASTLDPNAVKPDGANSGIREKGKVMVIPFEKRMYYSEIDRELSETSNLEFKQIMEAFRKQLELYLIAESEKESYKAISLNNINDDDKINDLSSIYGAMRYDYAEFHLKKDIKDDKASNMKSKRSTSQARDEKPIEQGQIAIEAAEGDRFMNSTLMDEKIYPYLFKKYGTDSYIFINQMDIKQDLSGAYKGGDERGRVLKVHYTITSINGKEEYSGVSAVAIPGDMNNIDDIIKTKLPLVAKSIVSHIPMFSGKLNETKTIK